MSRSGRSMVIGGAALLLVSSILGCASGRVAPRSGVPGIADVRGSRFESRPLELVLRLGERRVYVLQLDGGDGTPRYVDSFPVAIGRKEYATPTGRFQVTEKKEHPHFVTFDWNDPSKVTGMIPPGPDNPLGLRWIGFTSAYGWGIGFHGTPHPELLGQAVSHGCVRMRNSDVVKLYDLVRVGTTVVVQP